MDQERLPVLLGASQSTTDNEAGLSTARFKISKWGKTGRVQNKKGHNLKARVTGLVGSHI